MVGIIEPRCEKTGIRGFRLGPTQRARLYNHTRRLRGLKFRIWEVEGLYYLCSENKGADQLRGYREADLRLFSHMQKAGFLITRLKYRCTMIFGCISRASIIFDR